MNNSKGKLTSDWERIYQVQASSPDVHSLR